MPKNDFRDKKYLSKDFIKLAYQKNTKPPQMKKILLAVMLLCSVSVFAKEPVKVLKNEFPVYEGVISFEGKTKLELQGLLREWIAINFKSAQDVVQLDDEKLGAIIVKGAHSFNTQSAGIAIPNNADFSLNLRFKDNRFKYEIRVTEVKTGTQNMSVMSDILLKEIPVKPSGKPYKGMMLKTVNKNKNKILAEIDEFKNNLISRLDSINSEKTEDDW